MYELDGGQVGGGGAGELEDIGLVSSWVIST